MVQTLLLHRLIVKQQPTVDLAGVLLEPVVLLAALLVLLVVLRCRNLVLATGPCLVLDLEHHLVVVADQLTTRVSQRFVCGVLLEAETSLVAANLA